MNETTILSTADIENILKAAKTRTEHDTEYAAHLLETLCAAARSAELKRRFWSATYDRRSSRFMLYQLYHMQEFGTMTFNVEDIINEHDVLEKLAAICGQYVVATYDWKDDKVNVYLEFKPETMRAEIPVAQTLEERRLEKETSW